MGMTTSTKPHRADGTVVPLNEASALYLALADEIRGTAVGLSPAGLELLRHGLEIRFGPLLASENPTVFDRLVALASTPAA